MRIDAGVGEPARPVSGMPAALRIESMDMVEFLDGGGGDDDRGAVWGLSGAFTAAS